MSTATAIEWTDTTWNPVRGCSIVSPGCINCYAMKQAHRFSGPGRAYEGLTKLTERSGPQWTGAVRTVEDALLEPLSWRTPRRVFVNSMSDLFHEDAPVDFVDRVFAVMALAKRHTFQVLTKRPHLMHRYLTHPDVDQRIAELAMSHACRGDFDAYDDDWTAEDAQNYIPAWPLPNVWLGVSAEDQQRADERIPLLLQTPAAVRFVSAEPLLGPIDLMDKRAYPTHTPGLDWVIVGGESGSGARPLWVPAVRRIVEQCRAAGVAVFVKQLGANVRDRNDAGFLGEEPDHWPDVIDQEDRIEHDLDGTRDGYQGAPVRIHLKHHKGGDPTEWPEDLRLREFPRVGGAA